MKRFLILVIWSAVALEARAQDQLAMPFNDCVTSVPKIISSWRGTDVREENLLRKQGMYKWTFVNATDRFEVTCVLSDTPVMKFKKTAKKQVDKNLD